MKSSYCLIVLLAFIFGATAKKKDDGLFLVHIITHHGDRTPASTYPKDLYKNEMYYPTGRDQLTNAGKQRMYNTGLLLKKRYQKFLGNFYLPYQVEVMSSNYDNTQMTAQLLMAAMYPPRTAQVWYPKLNWQPIPIKYTRWENDRIFLPEKSCKKFVDLRTKNEEDQRKQGKFKEFQPVFKSLQKSTGLKVTLPSQVTKIYETLKCQKGWGLKLPLWTHDVYPDAMERVVDSYWSTYANTDDLKRLGAGFMFKKIIDDTTKKINGTETDKQMKIHVYSAHGSSIASMLQLLDVFDGHAVPYGAYILIEIHKKGKDYTVKVVYQNTKQNRPKIMHPNKCSRACGYNEFVNNYKKYFGGANMC